MDHFTSTETPQPWWADVAHLRDDAPHRASAPTVIPSREPEPRPVAERERPRRDVAERPSRAHGRASRSTGAARSGRRGAAERTPTDWFTKEARGAGRRSQPLPDPSRPARPRATLVDVSPDHAILSRPVAVRRAPGERPTVTITGRPDAALPPRVQEPRSLRGRRTREQATSLVASPDRMILWAVALGLLMILASIGTASADAAVLLP